LVEGKEEGWQEQEAAARSRGRVGRGAGARGKQGQREHKQQHRNEVSASCLHGEATRRASGGAGILTEGA
jgi:IS5 family transposase